MKPEENTKEQIDELAQIRHEIGEVADRLNNILTAVLGNVALAKIYIGDDRSKDVILDKLAIAEEAFPEIKVLTRRLLTISNQE